jgi:transposase InsO family protein
MSKQRVIVEAVLAGKSQTEVARLYGISQPRVSQLVAAWRTGGWDALESKTTRPHTSPNAISDHMITLICDMRRSLLADGHDAGPRSIAARLTRAGHTPPAISTIWHTLTKAGLITPEPRKRPKHSYLRFEADLPNECWQSDFTHWRLTNGTDAEILLWLDDHSRFIISATAHQPVTGHTVIDTFRAACTQHGTPQSTLTDNGLVFTTRHLHGPNAFEIELLTLGIQQKNGRPNHPQTQGKVERLNQTLKTWLHARPRATSLPELQHQLDEFTENYNTDRPHSSLRNRTPAETYTARAKATPEHNRTGHFRIRDDIVSAAGSVSLRRGGRLHHIQLGTQCKGLAIRMLVHDLDVIVIDKTTGEILRELTINPDKDSQPRGLPPGPKKGSPRQGGIQKGYTRNPKK